MEVYNPSLRDPVLRFPIGQYPNPDTGETVTVTESVVYDAAAQVNDATWYYQCENGNKPRMTSIDLRVIFPQELDALLHYNSFIIESKYGDFDETNFDSSSQRQILVCRLRR